MPKLDIKNAAPSSPASRKARVVSFSYDAANRKAGRNTHRQNRYYAPEKTHGVCGIDDLNLPKQSA